MTLTLFHGMNFAVVFAICMRSAWPPLLVESRARIDGMATWKASAARTWWICPFWSIVATAWECIRLAQVYTLHSSIAVEWPWTLAVVLLTVAMLSKRMAEVIRTAVHQAILPEQRGCIGCGYSVFGLTGSVCPECGRTIDRGDSWRVSFGFRDTGFTRRAGRFA